jgi:peptidoglycan hydrolase-like protein with peptidoglycan-binding domain
MLNILAIGSTGKAVFTLATRLIELGYLLKDFLDNEFTPAVEKAVKDFQRDKDLVADGIVGPKTQKALSSHDNNIDRLLKQSDLDKAADVLGVPVAAIMAVNSVESRGRGFLEDGRPVILFERHIMRRRMLKNGIEADAVGLAESRWPGLVNRETGGYQGGLNEWVRLEQATAIHRESALESCSWGQFQIMGYHWQALGYGTIDNFVNAMTHSESAQLEGFVHFILASTDLHNALKAQDWVAFARLYNGPGYERNHYDTRLALAFKRHS